MNKYKPISEQIRNYNSTYPANNNYGRVYTPQTVRYGLETKISDILLGVLLGALLFPAVWLVLWLMVTLKELF